jgi:hypothetical protein
MEFSLVFSGDTAVYGLHMFLEAKFMNSPGIGFRTSEIFLCRQRRLVECHCTCAQFAFRIRTQVANYLFPNAFVIKCS